MPTNVKNLENQTGHRTKAELAARAAAEAQFLPQRKPKLKPPQTVKDSREAMAYWRGILKRMDGLGILDDLDAEVLGTYCEALVRKDELSRLTKELIELSRQEADPEVRLEFLSSLDSLLARLQAHEKTVLSYADKLGLHPESRARLARKRAAQEAEQVTDDLFGD